MAWRDFSNDVLSAPDIMKPKKAIDGSFRSKDDDLPTDAFGNEAGYADGIDYGVDKVQGDYSTLPPHLQHVFRQLRKMAKVEGINMEMTFKDAGGTRFGTLSKRMFLSALLIAFQHFVFSPELQREIAAQYGTGEVDRFCGGKQEVAWRDFVNDVLMAPEI